jgi:Glycosyl hydrolases family 16
MKAAPGAGIVSTLVLQSDDLDEIDMEWLGADGTEVQTNYFGKGDVTTYNRGAFNPAANNQNEFITYTVEWTASQVTWSVGGTIVRVLTPATADANQYPQTPMQVKFGAWSGGDSSNAPGTIAWARGPTVYGDGPFTMTVQSIAVTDYSTGTQYKYGDTTGDWGSIQAVGGKINGNSGGAASTVASADIPAVTSASPSIPAGVGNTHGSTSTLTGWPWVATTLSTATGTYTSAAGVPSGWIITSSGKIVPASSAAVSKLLLPSLPSLYRILLTKCRHYRHQTLHTLRANRPRHLRRLLAMALRQSQDGTIEAFQLPEQSPQVGIQGRRVMINRDS